MSIGNILSNVRNKPSRHANVLLALLPIPPKMTGAASKDRKQRETNHEILRDLMEEIFEPLASANEHGVKITCGDGNVRLCFPRLAAWIADHMENVTLHGIVQNRCPACEEDVERLGEVVELPAKARDYSEYRRMYYRYIEGDEDAGEELRDLGVKLAPGIFWELSHVVQVDLYKPDILHVIYLGIFQTHLMKWVVGFLKKHKRLDSFDKIWMLLPPYPGFSPPNKEYSRVSQWQGKEMRNLVKVLVPSLAAALRRPNNAERIPFVTALRCVRSIVDFTLMAQYRSHSDETLQYMSDFLDDFHKYKDIFLEFRKDKATARRVREVRKRMAASHTVAQNRLRAEGASTAQRRRAGDDQRRELQDAIEAIYDDELDFNFVKIHLLSHFKDHVHRFGSIGMYSTESGESSHKQMIKEGYRRSNKNDATFQILRAYARIDNFRMHDMNAQCDPGRIHSDVEHPPEELRELGSRVAPSKNSRSSLQFVSRGALGSLPELLVDYYRRSGQRNITAEMANGFHVEEYRLLKVPIRCFQDPTEVTWHLLRCTGQRLWRTSGKARNDWVWVDTGNEELYGALRGCFPARLCAIFKVRNTVNNRVDRLVLVDRLFAESSGKPQDASGLVTVIMTGSVASTMVVSIKRILGMAHLVPESAAQDNKRWYVNNRIDLETFNRVYY